MDQQRSVATNQIGRTGQVIRSYRFGTLSTPLSNCRTNPHCEQTTTNAVMTEFGTASII
jgi:hypothetical protein